MDTVSIFKPQPRGVKEDGMFPSAHLFLFENESEITGEKEQFKFHYLKYKSISSNISYQAQIVESGKITISVVFVLIFYYVLPFILKQYKKCLVLY